MKKHNEGYTLVLVLIIMLILSSLAASILTISLRNAQNQKNAAQRMAERYAVEGEINSVCWDLEAMVGSGDLQYLDVRSVLAGGGQVAVEENIIAVRVRSGRIQGDCVLALHGENISIAQEDTSGVYKITNLGGVNQVHCDIYIIEEVAANAQGTQ